jgi:hypothetical protein
LHIDQTVDWDRALLHRWVVLECLATGLGSVAAREAGKQRVILVIILAGVLKRTPTIIYAEQQGCQIYSRKKMSWTDPFSPHLIGVELWAGAGRRLTNHSTPKSMCRCARPVFSYRSGAAVSLQPFRNRKVHAKQIRTVLQPNQGPTIQPGRGAVFALSRLFSLGTGDGAQHAHASAL